MTFLPIVERHLRVESRKAANYWGKTILGLGITLFVAVVIWSDGEQSTAELGRNLFMLLSGISFPFVLGGGVGATADSISSEKRDGTLGLLFLTDLKGIDIVVGKLVSGGLVAFYAFLTGVPLMALPFLLGGVTGEQVWKMALVILNSLFFSLCVGLFVSARSRSAIAAILGSLALVGFFTIGLLALEVLLHELNGYRYNEPALGRIGPLVAFICAMPNTGMPNQTVLYWHSMASTHLLAWAFLWAAARTVPHVWQEKGLTVKQLQWRERLTRWSVGKGDERKAYRAKMLERNPVCWLDDRYRLQKSLLWAALLAAVTFGMWLFSLWPTHFLDDDTVIPSVLITQGVLLVWLAFAATHRLAEDKRSGALELLLTTPISVSEIVHGRLMALRRQFGWIILCVNVASVLMIAGGISMEWGGTWPSWPQYYYEWKTILICVGGILMFICYVRTIALTGQWFALASRNSLVATVMTLVAVVGIHWAALIACMVAFIKLDQLKIIDFDPPHAVALWLGLGLANCAFWYLWSRHRLNKYFRHVACRLPLPTPPWKRLARYFLTFTK